MSPSEWSARRLAHDTGLTLLHRGLSSALGLAGVLLATALLEPEQYGVFVLVLTCSSLVYAFSASWTILPAYVQAGREFGLHGSVGGVARARLAVTVQSLAVVLAIAAVVVLISGAGSDLRWPVVAAWCAASVGYVLCEHVSTLAESSGKYLIPIAVQLSRPLIFVSLLLWVLWSGTVSLDLILVFLAVSWTAAITVSVFSLLRLDLHVAPVISGAKEQLLRASKPLFIYSVSQLAIAAVDLAFLRFFGRLSDVGRYGLAYQIYATGVLLVGSLIPVMTPRLARVDGSQAGLRRYVAHTSPAINRYAGPALGLLACCAPLALSSLFGAEYSAAASPLVILVMALAATVGATILHPVLVVRNRARAISGAAALALVVNALLDWLLIGILGMGIVGPAIATAAAMSVVWFWYARVAAAEAGLGVRRSGELILMTASGSLCGLVLSPLASAFVGFAIVMSLAIAVRMLTPRLA